MRQVFIISSIVIVIAGLSVAGYFLFFAKSVGIAVAPPSTTTSFPSSGNATSGSSPSTGQTASSTSTVGTAPSGATQVAAKLVEIDKGMIVAGEVAFDTIATSTGTTTKDVEVEYLNRQSGNVFSYLWNAKVSTRLSNKTIPGIEAANWLASGATAFIQYLSGTDNSAVNTYALPASGTGGFFLPQNISGLAVSTNSILYLASGGNGSIASVEKPNGTALTQAFTTPLSQVRVSFAGKNYVVSTKPSAVDPGYAFLVVNGAFTPIAGPLDGIVALPSPAGTYALVSYSAAGIMKMELVNIKTHQATALPVATIADKCVWSADESAIYCGIPTDPSAAYAYPDDWYQGAVHFSDKIWKIDVQGRFAQLVLDFSATASTSLDATNLAIDPAQRVLVFRNKNDGSLWGYQLQ